MIESGYDLSVKDILVVMFIGIVLALLVVVGTIVVEAQGRVPEDVEVFYVGDLTCIVWPDGSGDCYCPCDVECGVGEVKSSPTPGPRPTDEPQSTPTNVPTNVPTDVPQPTDIPPVRKPSCNRGLGNGPEDCDPGNSGDKPGSAGERNE